MIGQHLYTMELNYGDAATLRALFADKIKAEEEFISRMENNPAIDGRLQPIIEHAKTQSALFSRAYDALSYPVGETIIYSPPVYGEGGSGGNGKPGHVSKDGRLILVGGGSIAE